MGETSCVAAFIVKCIKSSLKENHVPSDKETLENIKAKLKTLDEKLDETIKKYIEGGLTEDALRKLITELEELKRKAIEEFPPVLGKPFGYWFTPLEYVDVFLKDAWTYTFETDKDAKDRVRKALEAARETKKHLEAMVEDRLEKLPG
jgi:hypothetical protein